MEDPLKISTAEGLPSLNIGKWMNEMKLYYIYTDSRVDSQGAFFEIEFNPWIVVM